MSGGWSGINAAIYEHLQRHFQVRYIGPINCPIDYPAKILSKLRRLSRAPGSFHFYSARRLKAIAAVVESQIDETFDCDFFHGPTPWILYQSRRPYFVYTDTCFANYIDVYHNRPLFHERDIKRICDAEADFLKQASRVFFGTQWALDKAVDDYGLPLSNLMVAGVGGHISIPSEDCFQGAKNFLFVAHDFEQKGGRICAESFKLVQRSVPDARLILVGGPPPHDVLKIDGVHYAGFLHKTSPVDMNKLRAIFSEAFALVHPTSSDINPLVIIELGYFGCPVVAPKSFGIPELIRDGESGFLIEPPLTVPAFAEKMLEMCMNRKKYHSMRESARTYTTSHLTWERVGERISSEVLLALSQKEQLHYQKELVGAEVD